MTSGGSKNPGRITLIYIGILPGYLPVSTASSRQARASRPVDILAPPESRDPGINGRGKTMNEPLPEQPAHIAGNGTRWIAARRPDGTELAECVRAFGMSACQESRYRRGRGWSATVADLAAHTCVADTAAEAHDIARGAAADTGERVTDPGYRRGLSDRTRPLQHRRS